MSNYLTDIDPIGESYKDNECLYCETPCTGLYCSKQCKNADLD